MITYKKDLNYFESVFQNFQKPNIYLSLFEMIGIIKIWNITSSLWCLCFKNNYSIEDTTSYYVCVFSKKLSSKKTDAS